MSYGRIVERVGIDLRDAEGRRVAGGLFVNPDGRMGGIVPLDLEVPDGVYIDATAVVKPGARLSPNQIVGPFTVVGPTP